MTLLSHFDLTNDTDYFAWRDKKLSAYENKTEHNLISPITINNFTNIKFQEN